MNSLQKPITQSSVLSHEEFLLQFEKNLAQMSDIDGVEKLMLKLQFLGLNYDPFRGEVTSECQQVMDNLGLTIHLQNPYLATNILLRLLDKTEEQLNKLKQ
jgi:hypothetical protein